jgi:hypothetical protein
MTVQLGDTIRETILGYEGVVTSITEYLYGCRRCQIEFKSKDGKIQELTFDEPRLKVVKSSRTKPKQDTGGDRPRMPRTGARR